MKSVYRKPLISLLAVLAAVIAAFIPAGCTDDMGPSLKSVPANSDYAVLCNLKLSAETTGTDLTSPQSLGQSPFATFMPPDFSEMIPKTADFIDLSAILIFKPKITRDVIVGVTLLDEGDFKDVLADNGWTKMKTGIQTAYRPAASSSFSPGIIIEDGCAWFLASNPDIQKWGEIKESAKEKSYADFHTGDLATPDVSEMLMLASPTVMGFPADKNTMIAAKGISQKNPSRFTFASQLIDVSERGNGKALEFNILAPVDVSSAMPFMPAPPALTLIAGITKGINWGALTEMMTGLGTQNQGMLQSLVPYLSSLDGTLALGVGPLNARSILSEDIENQTLLIYGKLEGNRAIDAVNEINSNLKAKGLNPRPGADGIYSYTLNGHSYSYTARDGAFIFALNRPIDINNAAQPGQAAPKGTQLVGRLTLPPLKAIVPEATVDVSLTVDAVVDTRGMRLVFESPTMPPISAIATYINAIRKSKRITEEASEGFYDDY